MPQLATEWTIQHYSFPIHDPETALGWYCTYYLKIRTGVPFQCSAFGNLATADVEYCFERGMVTGFSGDPQWMFYEPLLNGVSHAYAKGTTISPENNLTERVWVGKCIDHAVESNGTHVWFNLAFPGAYALFMQILSSPSSSIYSKVWALSLGRTNWNSTWGDSMTGQLTATLRHLRSAAQLLP